jgi:hypothetical protein
MIVVDHKISNLSVISSDDFEELKNITEKYGERTLLKTCFSENCFTEL